MKLARYAFVVTALAFAFFGCRVIDPAEDVPSYIRINAVSLSTNSNEGSNSQKITDAWIYVDGELLGGFELPCTVPILKEGNHAIRVFAGIQQNGMSTMRAIYPYYKVWESNITLTKGTITEVAPAFTYITGASFDWMSDFNSVGTTIDDSIRNLFPGMIDLVSGADAFEGNSAGITLTEAENYCYLWSKDSFQLDAASELYLELNYKCDQSFEIGLANVSNNPPTPTLRPWIEIVPTTSWNKIYVRFNDALYDQPPGSYYRIYFFLSKPPSTAETHAWLDNIKFIR